MNDSHEYSCAQNVCLMHLAMSDIALGRDVVG